MDLFQHITSSLDKLHRKTVNFFGDLENVKKFLSHVYHTSSITCACNTMSLNVFVAYKLIKTDKLLESLIDLAKEYSAEMAEGILYERAVHGYDKEIYDLEEKKDQKSA